VSLVLGSVSVGLSATPIPLVAQSPGSVTLIWSGAQALTLGGANVVAGQAQPGQVVIPAGAVIPLAKLGSLGVQGSLYGITVTGAGILSWLYGTDINS
jgi:hypothetical protein